MPPTSLLAAFPLLAMAVLAALAMRRERCPRCGERALETHEWLRVRQGGSVVYYQCGRCRGRCQRWNQGAWGDASGPRHDAMFKDAPSPPRSYR
jgi:hypothetical protein